MDKESISRMREEKIEDETSNNGSVISNRDTIMYNVP